MNDDKFAKDIRLTIDMPEDFETLSSIYADLHREGKTDNVKALFDYIEGHEEIKKRMKEMIIKNTK